MHTAGLTDNVEGKRTLKNGNKHEKFYTFNARDVDGIFQVKMTC